MIAWIQRDALRDGDIVEGLVVGIAEGEEEAVDRGGRIQDSRSGDFYGDRRCCARARSALYAARAGAGVAVVRRRFMRTPVLRDLPTGWHAGDALVLRMLVLVLLVLVRPAQDRPEKRAGATITFLAFCV